jgi:integrase
MVRDREVEGSNPFAPSFPNWFAERILKRTCLRRTARPKTRFFAEVFRRRVQAMSRRVPSYRKHKQSRQAIVTLTDGHGNRHDVLLGKYGTKESRIEYARILAEWEASGKNLPTSTAADITIAELIVRFLPWVSEHYRHLDGSSTTEVGEYKLALRPVNFLYGNTAAKEFKPLALKAVRQLLIEGYEHPTYGPQPNLARGVVNKRVNRIRRLFRWGVENDLVPGEVHQSLLAVEGLRRGRSAAKETTRVLPVPRGVVDDTLPVLRPMVADMVCLQLESGMRPGELVIMRGCDIDMTGNVWLYRPSSHKTLHLDHDRIIPIGPKGQEIMRRYLTMNTQAPLFSPRMNQEQRHAQRRQKRKTPLWPSHQRAQAKKRKRNPKRRPQEQYTVTSYARSITQAIKRHNAGKSENEQIPHWHPHQLRHLRALELKRAAGLDVARAVLGHKCPAITEHYATLDIAKAAEVMAKIG